MTSLVRTLLASAAATVTLVAGTALPTTADDTTTAATPDRPGLSSTVAVDATRGIATFAAVPTDAQVAALRDLGLAVQPMESLPLALVDGPTSALRAAVTGGIATDVYPDERLSYDDTASSNVTSSSAKAARRLRARGLTGKGVRVGVIDSGCDATHPDLADRVKVNQTLVSPEYANQEPSEDTTLVVPVNEGPGSNTDIGSGHGTHVGGIIAADGTSGRSHLGVAPDATLACFGIGAVITTTAVVTGFDHILSTRGHFGIDVINNSWGNSFRQFDPADPVNVATKAASRAGMTVVFSAGNSGYENAEASMSPFNQAPWVIAVAASDLDRVRGAFSANGLKFDNSRPVPIGDGGHTVHRRDRVGLVHPDMSAPGVDISSSCSSTGSVIGPCPTHGDDTASGTSMSSPHVAGAAAVLVGAQRRLSPAQVQKALYASASAVRTEKGRRVAFWQVGFGHVNLDRAVDLVRGAGWRDRLATAYRKAKRRALRSDAVRVTRSDQWQYDAPAATLGGSDSASYRVRVRRGVDRLHLTMVYPTPGIVANVASYTATLIDPRGQKVGTTTTSTGYALGTATLDVPARRAGRYRIEVTGDWAVSDPDTIDSDSINGRVVFVDLAQLRKS